MNGDSVIFSLVAVSWASALFGGAKYVVASSIFDIRQARAAWRVKKKPYQRRLRQRPMVSVIVLVDGQAQSLEQCLTGLHRSGYRKYEVIIVDVSDGDSRELKQALKAAKGQMALFISPSQIMAKNSLKNAVNQLISSDSRLTSAVTTPVLRQDLASIARLLEHTLITNPSNKLGVLRGTSPLSGGILCYTGDIKEPRRTEKLPNRIDGLKRLLAASWGLLFGYLAYLAIAHKYALPLAVFILSVFIYATLMISGEAGLNFKAKIKAILTLPGGLSLMLIALIIKQIKKASQFFYEALFPAKLFKKI